MPNARVVALACTLLACTDPAGSSGDDNPTTETGDSSDDPGESDDTGEGDGDGDGDGEPEPAVPELFGAVPGLDDAFAISPEHLFVVQEVSGVTRMLRVTKADGSAANFAQPPAPYVDLVASDSWLFAILGNDVIRMSFDSGDSATVIAVALGTATELAVSDAYLFWLDIQGQFDTLFRINFDGTGSTVLNSGQLIDIQSTNSRLYGVTGVRLVELDVDDGSAYLRFDGLDTYHAGDTGLYFEYVGTLQSLALDGGEPSPLVPESDLGGALLSLASDDQHLYWSAEDAEATIRRVPVTGGPVEVLASFELPLRPIELRLDQTHAYWLIREGDQPAVWRLQK